MCYFYQLNEERYPSFTIAYFTLVVLHVKCSYQCQVIQEVINVKPELNNKRGLNFADLTRPKHCNLNLADNKSLFKTQESKVRKNLRGFFTKWFQKFLLIPDYLNQVLSNWAQIFS